jgi:PAS domain S-box-containing protein
MSLNAENLDHYHQLQKELQQLTQEASLAEMINDASIDRVLAVDTDLRIIAWNKTCEKITGKCKQTVMNMKLTEIFPQIDEYPEITKGINMALKGMKVFVPHDKGSYDGGYSETHFIPLKNEEGTVIGVLNIIHDVAHRIKAENDLRRLNISLSRKNRELENRNAELLSFAHITSHDLKEPLRKIYTFIEMILTDEGQKLTDKSRSYFRRIQASAQRMGLLTDDIAAFAQINTENNVLTTISLNDVMNNVQHSLRHTITNLNATIEVGALPEITGYRSMLTQLFQNLLTNALKFQKEGNAPKITISAGVESANTLIHTDAISDTEYLKVSVADNGIGFEEKYAERIFQMFQRLHTAADYSGTGIGLALCRKIMEMHHGYIIAQSEPGVGSVFNCYFPLNHTPQQ